jgi:hypothetical protein
VYVSKHRVQERYTGNNRRNHGCCYVYHIVTNRIKYIMYVYKHTTLRFQREFHPSIPALPEKGVERFFPISNASTGNVNSVSRACYVIHQLRLGRTSSNTCTSLNTIRFSFTHLLTICFLTPNFLPVKWSPRSS